MVFGHMAAQALAATVRLGVADRLGDAEREAADLGADLGADLPAGRRQEASRRRSRPVWPVRAGF